MFSNNEKKSLPLVTILGDLLWDVFIPVQEAKIPPPDSAWHIHEKRLMGLYPGGTINFVAALNAVGYPKNLIHFISIVGNDRAGQALIDEAKKFCHIHVQRIKESPTGNVICYLHGNGERGMLVSVGASGTISPEAIPVSILEKTRVFFAQGFFLVNENKKKTLFTAMKHLPKDTLLIFDPGADTIIKQHSETIKEMLTRGIDIFLPNKKEFCTLLGISKVNSHAIREFFDAFPRTQIVSVTLGKDGAITAARNSNDTITHSAPTVPVVDTTGAGDAYAGAFIGTLLMTRDLDNATKSGILMSSSCIQYLGGYEYLKQLNRVVIEG